MWLSPWPPATPLKNMPEEGVLESIEKRIAEAKAELAQAQADKAQYAADEKAMEAADMAESPEVQIIVEGGEEPAPEEPAPESEEDFLSSIEAALMQEESAPEEPEMEEEEDEEDEEEGQE